MIFYTMESRKIREPIREKNRVNFEPNSNSKASSPSKKKKESKPQEDVVANRVDNMENSNNSSGLGKVWLLWVFKVLLVILAVLFILLMIILAVNFISTDREDSSSNGVISNESDEIRNNISDNSSDHTLTDDLDNSTQLVLFQENIDTLEIVVIENSNCEFCQVNETMEDLRDVLVSLGIEETIEFTRITHNSTLANQVLQVLRSENQDFDFTPLFLLPSSIENLELFQEPEFRSLFISVSSENFYVLNPQITTIKYLNSPLMLPQNTISFGNLQGVPVTYIYDYNCVRCQVMSGNEEEIQNFISLDLIEDNYTAPIPQLLSALIGVENSSEDVTFNLRFVPAPVSANSEIAHRAIFCATNQDLFIPMHVELVEIHNGSTQLSVEDVVELAQSTIEQLNIEEFETCISSQAADNFIDETYGFLRSYGVTSLPFTIIGNYPVPELIDYLTLSVFLESEMSIQN